MLFHFTISMFLLRTLYPMLQCICMYVDVMVCVCLTLKKQLLTYLLINISLSCALGEPNPFRLDYTRFD